MTPLDLMRSRRTGPAVDPFPRLSRLSRTPESTESASTYTSVGSERSEISELSPPAIPDIDSAAALLDRLEKAGLTARVVDGTLRVGPPDRLADELRAEIAAYREIIIQLLATAQPAPVFDVDLLTCSDAALAEAIASHPDLTMELVLEADRLGHELRHDGRVTTAAFRWFVRHPAPGNARGDHLAALVAVRLATDLQSAGAEEIDHFRSGLEEQIESPADPGGPPLTAGHSGDHAGRDRGRPGHDAQKRSRRG